MSITHEELAWLAGVLEPATGIREPLLAFVRNYLEKPTGVWSRVAATLRLAFGLQGQ